MVESDVAIGYYLQNVKLESDTGIIEIQNNNFEFYGFNQACNLVLDFAPVENKITIRAGYDNTKDEKNSNLGTFELIVTDQDGEQTIYENSNAAFNFC